MAVEQKFTGSADQLLKEYEKVLAQQQKMEDKLQRMTEESRKSSSTQTSGAVTAAKTIMSMAASYVSVQSAIQLISGAMAAYNETLRESADLSTKMAVAQSDALKNMAGMTTAQKRGMIDKAGDISLRTGFADQSVLIDAMGAGVSAGGGEQLTLSAIEAAARLTTNKPEQLKTFSAGAIDIGRAIGSTDSEKNLGFLLQAGAQARVVDPEQLAENMAPVVASAAMRSRSTDKELVAREAAAIYTTLSKASTDVEGRSSTTAATQFMGHMETFFKDRKDAPITPMEQMQALATDEKLKKEFFKQDFGEEKYKAAFQAIVTEGSLLQKEMLSAKEAITFSKDEYNQQVNEARSATPELMTSDLSNQLQSVNNQLTNDSANAFKEKLRQAVKDNLSLTRSSQGGYMRDYLSEFGAGMGIAYSDSPEQAIQEAKDAISLRLSRLQSDRRDAVELGAPNVKSDAEIGAEVFLKMLERFEKAADKQDWSNDVLVRFLEDSNKQGQAGTTAPQSQSRNQEGADN